MEGEEVTVASEEGEISDTDNLFESGQKAGIYRG